MFDADFYAMQEPARGGALTDILCDELPDISGEVPLVQGDFYASRNQTTRGLSLGMFSCEGAEVPLGGTTCPEDAVPLGCTESSQHLDITGSLLGQALPGLPSMLAWHLPAPQSPLSSLLRGLLGGESSDQQVGSQMDAPRFLEFDTPPSTPNDNFFRFMVTTLFVSGISAARIGNLLLDFLVATAVARLEKVNSGKFSIKAEVRVDEYLSCMLKIRLYRRESECAVEFRRCSGDSVLFNACFREAWDKLVTCGEARVRI
jgi:hypothetical protein